MDAVLLRVCRPLKRQSYGHYGPGIARGAQANTAWTEFKTLEPTLGVPQIRAGRLNSPSHKKDVTESDRPLAIMPAAGCKGRWLSCNSCVPRGKQNVGTACSHRSVLKRRLCLSVGLVRLPTYGSREFCRAAAADERTAQVMWTAAVFLARW